MPLDSGSFYIVDCETTGLTAAVDQLVAVAAVALHLSASGSTGQMPQLQPLLHTLVNPGRSIPAEATAIHGITDEAVVGAPTPLQAATAVFNLAKNRIWVGHNLAFDMSFLSAITGQEIPKARWLDTMLLSSVIWPTGEFRHNLPAVAHRLGVPPWQHHNALADAIATAQVLHQQLPLIVALGITTLFEAQQAMLASPFAHKRRQR